jgi:hypothetical protein
MPDGSNKPTDEYANRPNDEQKAQHDEEDQYEYDEQEAQAAQQPLPFPLIKYYDLMQMEFAEYDTWLEDWKRGTVSDVEMTHAIQRIFTEVCMRSGLDAVTWEDAVEGLERLRTLLRNRNG